MRLINIILVCLAIFLPRTLVRGEGTPRILRFDPAEISIDTVKYDAGEQKLRFECTNICDKPVVILEVRSQCGCAKPTFGRNSIAPGGKGYVDVIFDPKTLFADQKKHLTVVASNGDYRKFNTLTITGYVDRGVTEDEVRYPYLLAPGLRSNLEALGMRLSKRGDSPERELVLLNTSSSEITLDWSSDDRSVSAELPFVIGPGETAKVKVKVRTWGIPSGSYEKILHLVVNGERSAPVSIKGAVQ